MRHEIAVYECEVLGEGAFTTEELARVCGVSVTWVHTHVEAGVIDAEPAGGRFGSAALLRARRIAQLEASFDADPQLAALTADLMDEVAHLRRRLLALGDGGD